MNRYYRGAARKGPYFEGWYLKFQTRNGRMLALIPALHIDAEGRRSASMQLISDSQSWWLEYEAADFRVSEACFCVGLGESSFSDQGVRIHIERPGCSLHGALKFGPFAQLQSDIMGPFRFIPAMECSHGVVSMGHALDGTLTLNGESFDFSGGTGYIETDRGRSFPETYLWTQCAWQEDQLASLMLSIATVPLSGIRFTGCICAIFYEGRAYRLATYRGARVEKWSQSGAVVRQGKYRLEADVPKGQGQPLRAPVAGAMQRTIHEILCAEVRYRFWIGRELLFEHADLCASFEYAGSKI